MFGNFSYYNPTKLYFGDESLNFLIPGITETTVVYPAGYLNLTKENVAEILKESM